MKRQKAVSASRQSIARLLAELELSPNTSFEREVVSDGEMVSLSVANMDALKQYNDEVCLVDYGSHFFCHNPMLQ